MADDATLAFYARNAADYVQHGHDAASPHLKAFMAALPRHGRVLELGTGSGRDAAALMAAGFAVTPSDASPELAAEAEQLLGCPVRQMRFDELEDEGVYDGLWANACLLHAPVAELTGDIARIHRALVPGGLFAASFKAGTGPGRDRFGRYYNYPDRETLLVHYREAAAWTEVHTTQARGSGYDGLPTQWIFVTARK